MYAGAVPSNPPMSWLQNPKPDRLSESASAGDAVTLTTYHSAKGLEWPVVFVIWVAEGMFPSSRTLGENSNPV